MKKINQLKLMTITLLLFSNITFGQKLIDDQSTINNQIVQILNTPTKMWVNGHWETTTDGKECGKKATGVLKKNHFNKNLRFLEEK